MKIEVETIKAITPNPRMRRTSSQIIYVETEQYQLEDMFNQIREDVGEEIMSDWLSDGGFKIVKKDD